MPQPQTNSEFVSRRFQDLLGRTSAVPEFELRRLEIEILKTPDEYEKAIDLTYLYSIWGKYKEARNWLSACGGYGPATALRYAGAAQAALVFHQARESLRYAADSNAIQTAQDKIFAVNVASYSCAIGLASEVLDMPGEKPTEAPKMHAAPRFKALGLEDENVQEYVTRALRAAESYYYGARMPLVIEHAAYTEIPDKILIRVFVPADPDDFGDILWAMSDIDRSGIPDEVSERVIISPMPAE